MLTLVIAGGGSFSAEGSGHKKSSTANRGGQR
jgi:hypothetical protein